MISFLSKEIITDNVHSFAFVQCANKDTDAHIEAKIATNLWHGISYRFTRSHHFQIEQLATLKFNSNRSTKVQFLLIVFLSFALRRSTLSVQVEKKYSILLRMNKEGQ